MRSPNLNRAAHAAYEMRKKYDPWGMSLAFDPFLPLSVEPDLQVCRYTTFCELARIRYEDLMEVVSSDGFTLRRGSKYIILYNDAPHIPQGRKRFTLAHELGHYALRHTHDGEPEEAEADCFARNLLAPLWLAQERGVSFDQYPQAFGVSAAAARMCERLRKIDANLGK